MKNRCITIAIIIHIFCIVRVFGQNLAADNFITHYRSDVCMPNIDKKTMDAKVVEFYRIWKGKYIKPSKNNGEFVLHDDGNDKTSKRWTSEGQGYGMLITVLMAKFDSSAKHSFDSLFNHYYTNRSHYSSNKDDFNKIIPNMKPFLMVDASTSKYKMGGTATDGDMDIAYSLLLADKIWGNNGKIKYADIADSMLEAIKSQEINKNKNTILMGNEIEDEKPENKLDYYGYDDMRSSDFMPSHLTYFNAHDKTFNWNKINDACYSLFSKMQTNYTFIPDFIHNVSNPIPMDSKTARQAGLSHESNTNSFSYNACRIPWRVALGYILDGNLHAKEIVQKMNVHIRNITNENPLLINEGYTLDGRLLISSDNTPSPLFFTAPFAVSAMVDSSNLGWLNKLWLNISQRETTNYYGDTIKMIALIILSGNYWTDVCMQGSSKY